MYNAIFVCLVKSLSNYVVKDLNVGQTKEERKKSE